MLPGPGGDFTYRQMRIGTHDGIICVHGLNLGDQEREYWETQWSAPFHDSFTNHRTDCNYHSGTYLRGFGLARVSRLTGTDRVNNVRIHRKFIESFLLT